MCLSDGKAYKGGQVRNDGMIVFVPRKFVHMMRKGGDSMPVLDKICPVFCASAGRMHMAKNPPLCISSCAWYDVIHKQCGILTIAQKKDLGPESVEREEKE